MVQSFAHRRPIYWYLPMLPVMLFPWLFALPVWRALSKSVRSIQDVGVRYCLAWFVPVFIAFSFISGKQPHYLLPIVPAFALLVARGWEELQTVAWYDRLLPTLVGLVVGVVLLYLPTYHQHHYLAPWLLNIPTFAGMAMILGSVFLMLAAKHKNQYLEGMTLLGLLAVFVLYLGVIGAAGPAYDVTKISQQLRVMQEQKIPLANVGKYHGQFNFLGRLKASPVELSEGQLDAWFEKTPNGRAIIYFDKERPLGDVVPQYSQPYRALTVGILNKDQWQAWSKQPHVPLATVNEVE
jgi:4-amino-4-deoxy-L-arabinose transferase-like glycosyltransferase